MKKELTEKDSRRKVLVLTSTFPRWAYDTTPPFVFELEKRLANDFAIFLLAPHFPGAKKREKMSNISVTRFQYFWPISLQKLCYEGGIMPHIKVNKLFVIQACTLVLCELMAAIKIVKREKISLIHAHWVIPQGIIAVLIKKLFGVPYIITTHGGDIYGLQNGFMRYIKTVVLKNAQSITVVSNAIKDEIEKDNNHQLPITVVSMGVDAKIFNPHAFDKSLKDKYHIHGPFLLYVGRLEEKKGIHYLLQAITLINKIFPKTILLIIGEGTIKEDLETLAKELKINGSVFFVGGIPNGDLPKYYATADIFIGPSIQTKDGDSEGLGLTFVEASFSGCIPIGTNIGGISDVIRNNQTGFLVREKKSQDIANAVIQILKDPNKLKKMKITARELTINTFDWEIVAKKYRVLYLK